MEVTVVRVDSHQLTLKDFIRYLSNFNGSYFYSISYKQGKGVVHFLNCLKDSFFPILNWRCELRLPTNNNQTKLL